MISIVLATTLKDYPNAASSRDMKLRRAITSVIIQSYKDWELLIICDGCEKSYSIANEFDDKRIRVEMISKGAHFSGKPRNTGIELAKYPYITYLDNDDVFGEHHLQTIADRIKGYDWGYYNDMVLNGDNEFEERICDPNQMGKCGTSNFTHSSKFNGLWKIDGYAHDFHFAQELKKRSGNYARITTPTYLVCHIPNQYDI